MRKERPTGVSILAIWYFLNGLSTFAGGLTPLFLPIPGGLGAITYAPIIIGLSGVIFGALYLAFGYGLWEGFNWARIGAIVLAALALVAYLFFGVVFLVGISLFGTVLSFPGVGIGLLILAVIEGAIIYYLLRPDVEMFFQPISETYPQEQSTVEQISVRSPVQTFSQPAPMQTPIRSEEPMRRPPRTELIDQPTPAAAWLVARGGSRPSKEFGLQSRSENVVGRDGTQSDIVLDDSTVSKLHAKIRFENGQFFLYDMGSTNGTFVNNRRVQRQSLLDGDDVRFGSTRFVFKEVRSPRSA